MDRNTGKAYQATQFEAHGGRRAGSGIEEDDYSEESFGGWWNRSCRPRFPNDDVEPEELNGPCIIIQKGKEVEK